MVWYDGIEQAATILMTDERQRLLEQPKDIVTSHANDAPPIPTQPSRS
jgi:hypothetical protein